MATGYEVQMYQDIHRIAVALEKIADAVEAADVGLLLREDAAAQIREYMESEEVSVNGWTPDGLIEVIRR